jgi:beta-galactosidase
MGRHFYAGAKLPARFCVINDKEDGSALPASELQWQLTGDDGAVLANGKLAVPQVAHYTRQWIEPQIDIPQILPKQKINGKLLLKLMANGKTVSENSYDVLLAKKTGLDATKLEGKKIAVFDAGNHIIPSLNYLGIKYAAATTLAAALKQKADVYILSGLDSLNTPADEIKAVKNVIANGGKVLLSASGGIAHMLYPEYIRSLLKENGEITTMDIPESPVFDGIEPLETRYLNNNKRESPSVISGAFRINRNPNVEALASFIKIHGYLSGTVNERQSTLDKIKGFPIVKIKDQGTVLLSEIRLEKTLTDPIAGKLLVNMLLDLTR